MRTLHSHLDVNKDGVISYDDFMLLGERFANLGHLTTDEKKEFQHVLNVRRITKDKNSFRNLFYFIQSRAIIIKKVILKII